MVSAKPQLAQELTMILAIPRTFALQENVLSAQLPLASQQAALRTLFATHQELKETSASSTAQLATLGNLATKKETDAKLSPVTLQEVSALVLKLIIFASPMLVENAQIPLLNLTLAQLVTSVQLVLPDKLLLLVNVMLNNATTLTTFAPVSTMNV